MIVVTREGLEELGLVFNPHMWIGDGWMYCRVCEQYNFHQAWSHRGESDCFEVCLVCGCYSGKYPVCASTREMVHK